jgi:hypothetical protein
VENQSKYANSIWFGYRSRFDYSGACPYRATRRMKQSEYILLLETMFEKAEKIVGIQAELALNSAKLAGRRA